MNNTRFGQNIEDWRLRITFAIVAIVMLFFIIKLYDYQILQGEEYLNQANENRFTRLSIPASRGVIYDSNDAQLVRNIPSFNVLITPALLPDSQAAIEQILLKISEATDVPLDQEGPPAAPCVPGRGIRQLVEEGESIRPFDPWPVACDIDEIIARILREQQVDMPGVTIEAVPIREYSTGELTSSVIGYLGPIPAEQKDFYEERGFVTARDKVGYAGIELTFNETLSGTNGQKLVEKDVAGLQLREVGAGNPAIPGNSIKLTIDSRLQTVARTALENRMDFINRYAGEVRTIIGAVVAMNPQTGEILAMVSLPTYENNRLARFIPEYYYRQLSSDESKPLLNHAVSSSFPPGSSFKMVTAVGALNENVISPTRTLNDPGKITITNRYFPNDPGKAKDFVCWKEDGHGDIDYVHGIAQSCNVYFYKIGGGYEDEVPDSGLGIDRLGIYARALGYGAPLGVDLPGEDAGLIPSEDWKRINLGESWSTGDTYNSVVGQGFVGATPLQVMSSIATIVNGGKVVWPHIVEQILDGEGNVIQTFEPCVLWDLTDGELTPLSDLAENCETMPQELKDRVRSERQTTPDLFVDPSVLELAKEGMRLVVTEGTAAEYAQLETISSGGKTGTGEFCDKAAFNAGRCEPGNWPTHSWYTAFAPFDTPEIIVTAFVYNGGEGAITAGPIVAQVLEAYFELKSIDTTG